MRQRDLVVSAVIVSTVLAGCTADVEPPDTTARDGRPTPSVALREGKAVRAVVVSFMERRIAGRAAEKLIAAARHRFRRGGSLAPLYFDPELQDFDIEFIDGLLRGPSYEVGVRLIFAKGSYGHTYFVGRHGGRYLISGGRHGLEGP